LAVGFALPNQYQLIFADELTSARCIAPSSNLTATEKEMTYEKRNEMVPFDNHRDRALRFLSGDPHPS
jgi:hypothetical protein